MRRPWSWRSTRATWSTLDAVASVQDDLARLLRAEGLDGVGVIVTSAANGEGVGDLRAQLAKAVSRRAAAVARLGADVGQAAEALASECAPRARAGIARRIASGSARRLRTQPASRSSSARSRTLTGGGGARSRLAVRALAPALPPGPAPALPAARAPAPEVSHVLPGAVGGPAGAGRRSDARTRAGAAGELPPPWPGLARTAATRREDEVVDRLDQAVAGADLHVSRPRWWRLAGLAQSGLALVTLAGLLWLVALAVLSWLRVDDVLPLPDVRDVPLPTLLLLGGALAGLLLAGLSGLVNRVSASRRGRAAGRSLRKRVDAVAAEYVLRPVEQELETHGRLCEELARAAS